MSWKFLSSWKRLLLVWTSFHISRKGWMAEKVQNSGCPLSASLLLQFFYLNLTKRICMIDSNLHCHCNAFSFSFCLGELVILRDFFHKICLCPLMSLLTTSCWSYADEKQHPCSSGEMYCSLTLVSFWC